MEIFFFWFVFAVLVAALASSRGRSAPGFFLLSIVLSPLIGLIAVLVMNDKNVEAKKEEERKQDQERHLASIRALAPSTAQQATSSGVPTPMGSVADELAKLAALRDQGVITAEEFDQQKRRVLGL